MRADDRRYRLDNSDRRQLALRDHALPFAEQVGHDALVAYADVALAVGHFETHAHIVAALQAARLDQPADADAGACRHMLFCDIGRRIEEHDGPAERVEHKPNRERQNANAPADQNQASLLAGHRALNPIFSIIASIWLRHAVTYTKRDHGGIEQDQRPMKAQNTRFWAAMALSRSRSRFRPDCGRRCRARSPGGRRYRECG